MPKRGRSRTRSRSRVNRFKRTRGAAGTSGRRRRTPSRTPSRSRSRARSRSRVPKSRRSTGSRKKFRFRAAGVPGTLVRYVDQPHVAYPNVPGLHLKDERPLRWRRSPLIPERVFVALVYSSHDVVDPETAKFALGVHISGNNPFDPDTDPGGHQPAGYDSYVTSYQNVKCHGSKLELDFRPEETLATRFRELTCGIRAVKNNNTLTQYEAQTPLAVPTNMSVQRWAEIQSRLSPKEKTEMILAKKRVWNANNHNRKQTCKVEASMWTANMFIHSENAISTTTQRAPFGHTAGTSLGANFRWDWEPFIMQRDEDNITSSIGVPYSYKITYFMEFWNDVVQDAEALQEN